MEMTDAERNAESQLILAEKFNKCIMRIFRMAESKLNSNNPDIDQLGRLLKLFRSTYPMLMIERCKDKLWVVREYILNKNEAYFLDRSYDEYIKKDKNQRFIETLIEMIQESRSALTDTEVEYIWVSVQEMLGYAMNFKILINDIAPDLYE